MQVLGRHVELALCEAMHFEVQVTQGYTHIGMYPCCAVQFILCHANKESNILHVAHAVSLCPSTHSHDEIQERSKDWESHFWS